jgi:hypothetical protein
MALKVTVDVTMAIQLSADLDIAATITTTVTAVPVPGVKVDQLYLVAFANADLDAGVLVQNPILCETDDELLVRLVNPTAGGINVAAATMTVIGL